MLVCNPKRDYTPLCHLCEQKAQPLWKKIDKEWTGLVFCRLGRTSQIHEIQIFFSISFLTNVPPFVPCIQLLIWGHTRFPFGDCTHVTVLKTKQDLKEVKDTQKNHRPGVCVYLVFQHCSLWTNLFQYCSQVILYCFKTLFDQFVLSQVGKLFGQTKLSEWVGGRP